jgi:hypothetical protein
MDDPSISIIFFSTKKGENDLAEKKWPGLETGSAVLRHLGLWLDWILFIFFSYFYIYFLFFFCLILYGFFCLDFFYFF